MSAYQSFNNGTMTDYIPTDEDIELGLSSLQKSERHADYICLLCFHKTMCKMQKTPFQV